MNKFSYADANQAVFSAWFDSVSADVKLGWAAAARDGSIEAESILADAGQAYGWVDSLIDSVLDFDDGHSGAAAVRRAFYRSLDLICDDGVAMPDAIAQAAAEFGVDPVAVRAQCEE